MEREEYARLYELERRFWWFRAKRKYVQALLDRAGAGEVGPDTIVVDVGCGTGATLARFGGGAMALGLDDHADALRFARERSATHLTRANATSLPLGSRTVDRLFLLDVAEHVSDDGALFGEVRRVLKPRGVAVIHVPAHPRLWSPHDEAMHHVRRYTRRRLEECLRGAGLETIVLSWTFAAVLVPVAVVRWWKGHGRGGTTSDFDTSSGAGPLLAVWHRMEAAWLRRGDLPFGVSLGAVVTPARDPA